MVNSGLILLPGKLAGILSSRHHVYNTQPLYEVVIMVKIVRIIIIFLRYFLLFQIFSKLLSFFAEL